MSEFTDKLMNRARELDSRPGLSSSSAPSGSSGGSGSFSERLLSRARELDRKVTPSYTWQGHEQAERDFDAWAPQIEEMDTSLANREKILNGYVERLQALQEEPYSQSNAYKYRAMYDNYEKALREYNDMVRERNALSGRMGSALEQYRNWSGGQDAQAETYRQEAAALDERNAELDREMRNYALINTPFGLENAGPYQAMQEEYDANAARAAELRRMADEAQWQYYGGLRLNEDWDEHQNVLTVAEMADRGYITESPYYDGSIVYEYINDINNRRDMMHGYDASGTRYEAYSKMTPDEIAVYNYIYSVQGPEAAETYLSRLRNELNTRLGTENYEEMGGLGKALYWIPAGFDRFAQGLRQLGQEEAVPVTPMTVTSSLIQQEAQETSPVLGGLYDLGANITNMVPSLLASVLTGGAFGAAAGSALLGASAGGNTYADVMRDPERQYSAQQARDYATLVGVSEGALSYLLGGISRLGGVSTRQVLTKLGGLDNALGRIARSSAAPYVMSMISEGTEEGLQELLEPAFATLILGTEYDANFGDAAYAFLLGALTAGIVEGAEIGVSRALGGGQGFTYSDMDGFVGENDVNYFEGCDTLEEVEARYRELARENHPDLGGDTSVMADINRQHDMAKAFFQGRRQGAEQRRERRGEAEGETARGVAGALTAAQEAAQTAGDVAAAERTALRADAAALAPRTVPNAVTAAPAVGETAAEALGDMAAAPGVSGALENNLGGITDERAERAAGVFGGDGGRLPDTGSGGQVRELEEGAGRTRLSSAEQGRAALERQAAARNLRAEKVSAADLGVASGTDTATSTVYPEELWDDELQHVAEEIYNRAGREVTYVIGSLEVEGTDGTRSRVRGVWSEDGNIIVQVDNMRVSASQIADHELYHHAANNLPGMDYVAEERIIEQYGEEEFSRVLDVYIKKMRGIIRLPANATNEEIDNALAYVKQEVFADAYAGINAFGAGADRFYDTVREVVEERTGGEPRSETEEATRDITGPPAGERYSYAGRNAANADLEALDTAEEMERRATPPDLGDENTVFADDEIPVRARFSLDEEEAAWDETAPVDAEGNRLSEQQREFFANSEVRLEPDGTYFQGQGRLLPVYHSTYNDFTVFDFNRLGENTDYYASDEWFGAGSHVGFWFNTQDLSGRAGTRTEKVYLNIQNIYALNSLDELASAIYNHSDSGEMRASEAAEAFRAALEAEGYDGLLIYNDDEFGGMSFVAFYPEQIKRTTNANPTNSEDIRYSISEPEREDVPAEQAEQGPRQRRQRRTTKPVAESKPIIATQNLRRNIYAQFSIPEGQRAEISHFLDGYTEKLIKNGELSDADRAELFDRLYAAGVMTVPADEYYSVGREAVVGRRMYVDEATKRDFGDDWNSIRRRAFGAGIYLTNNPADMAADQWNAELGETLPGLFNAEETDPRTIIERVIQVAEEGRDEQMSLAEYTNFLAGQEYVSEDEVLNQLENQLDWDLRTFAESAGIEIKLRDRTGVKIEQERERAWESRRDIRRRADERVREADERRWAAQAEARERIERMTQEERKKYYERSERERVRRLNRETRERERRKAMAERQRQNRELRELQKKTLNQLRWLARNQHRAPKELQETWNDVLGDIDLYAINAANEMNWSNKYQATWRDLAEMYKQAKKYDANFLPSQELERIVARLDNEKLADMDIGALQNLYKAAVGLRTEFYNRNNVINDEKGRLFAELYAESKEEINSAPGGYTKGVKHAADNYANLEQLTPMNVLERMAGWNPDSAFYSMAKQLEKGEMDERAYIVQANRMLEDFLREHEEWVMRSDGQGKDATWYEIEVPELLELGMGDKPIFGDTVKVYMTPAQKVHLYLESKNYDNLRHIAGGRTFPDKELYSEGKRQEAYAQGRTIRLAPETVRHLVENMTAEEQELAGILERYYNNFAAERINAVSNVLYGYDRAITRNYAPIYTNSNYNQKELGKFDQTAEGVGNMKERVKGSKNPSYNISAYDAFERHADQTARFVGMAIPARNWQTLLNWRERNNSMSDVITHKWGKESLDYITSLLQDLQGGSPRKEQFAISKGADKLWSNYISAIFGANPSIIIKQLGSIPMGGAYLGIENVPSLSQLAQIDRELISKYTSELDWRLMGYATPETKQLKDHPNWTQRNSFFRTVFGGGAITRMDGWAASTLWPWAENKVKKERPELTVGTAEEISAGNSPFYKEVAREFNNAVSRSQSMSDTLHNAKIRKSDNLVLRTFTMFKSDSAQTYNAIRQKIGEAQYYKRIGADAKAQRAARIAIGTAILAFLLNAAWGEAVNFLINLWKKKGENYRDEEGRLTAESAIKEMAFNMVGSLGGVVLGGEELADIIGNIITGDRWYGIDAPGIEQVNDTLEAILNAGKSLMNLVGEAKNIASQGGDVSAYFAEHSSDIVGGVKELAETAAMYLAGLPVSNVEAYILGFLRWVSPELVTAYEDALATADKSGLSSLTGEALATRVKDILAGRLETVDDETASAIGTLYEEGYASVVPPSAPSSVTVDHENYELDAYAQQRYNQAWADAIGGALDEVVATPEFRSATTEEKANMVSRLYEYANAKGRDAAVPEYVLPDWVAEVDADLAAGGSLSEWAVYEVLSSDVSGTFDRLTDEGLGRGDALDIAETLDELGEDASSTEKYMAIAELPISEAEKGMALEGIMSASAYEKYAAAREAGIDTYDYCVFLDHIAGISGDGRQERIWAYIDAMPLTDAQKDTLHLAAGYKESTLGKAPWRR